MLSHRTSRLWPLLLIFICSSFSASNAVAVGASMSEITAAVKNLCKGGGSASQFSVTGSGSLGASKAVSLVIDGKIAGQASFTKTEWDGVEVVRGGDYTSCVGKLTPIFIDKFAEKDNTLQQTGVKTLDVRLGIGPLRDFCAKNPGVPPPVFLMNPPEQAQCQNGTTDPSRPMCLCP